MSKITVFHKDYCPYCRAAKQVLDASGRDYTEIEVTHDARAFGEMVARSGGRRTVPQIFFGDTHIGGYDDLQLYISKHGALPSVDGRRSAQEGPGELITNA